MSSRSASPVNSIHSDDGGDHSPIVSSAVKEHEASFAGLKQGASQSSAAVSGSFESKRDLDVKYSSSSSAQYSGSYSSYHEQRFETITLAHESVRLRLDTDKGGAVILYVSYTWWDGRRQESSINLSQHIGVHDGVLRWGGSNFQQLCTRWELWGTRFIAKCRHSWRDGECDSEIDLVKVLHITSRGITVVAHLDFSKFMSEVSWMKFRVVAEPDMTALFGSSIFQGAVKGIAERTVLHVVEKAQAILQATLQETMEVVLKSSASFIEKELQAIVYSAYVEKASTSFEHLHIMDAEHEKKIHAHDHYRHIHWGGNWDPRLATKPSLPFPTPPHTGLPTSGLPGIGYSDGRIYNQVEGHSHHSEASSPGGVRLPEPPLLRTD